MHYDYLIVGAGLYGAVFANEAAKKGKSSPAVPAPAEPSYNHGSSIDFDSMLGDTQIPVSGIEASLNFCDGLGFETSYAFPVLNNFFVVIS